MKNAALPSVDQNRKRAPSRSPSRRWCRYSRSCSVPVRQPWTFALNTSIASHPIRSSSGRTSRRQLSAIGPRRPPDDARARLMAHRPDAVLLEELGTARDAELRVAAERGEEPFEVVGRHRDVRVELDDDVGRDVERHPGRRGTRARSAPPRTGWAVPVGPDHADPVVRPRQRLGDSRPCRPSSRCRRSASAAGALSARRGRRRAARGSRARSGPG